MEHQVKEVKISATLFNSPLPKMKIFPKQQ